MTGKRVVTALPGEQTISYIREFEAPTSLVFRAHVEPDLVSKWTGPAGTEVWMREGDARSGGAWSYVVVGKGSEWGFHGTFHEVTEPRRIVQTFEFEGHPEHPNFEILSFVNLGGGRCRLEGLSLFPTLQDRDDMLSGMDGGMDENFGRLDALIASSEFASACQRLRVADGDSLAIGGKAIPAGCFSRSLNGGLRRDPPVAGRHPHDRKREAGES